MATISSMPIVFRGNEYHALVRFMKEESGATIRVTVMNGILERMLIGRDIFRCKNGFIIADLADEEGIHRELQESILSALEFYEYHRIKELTGAA
jgi:hypothetical protein